MEFGENLAKHRRIAGISQKTLAEKLGISQRMLSHYEHRATAIPLELLPRIAIVLDTTLDQLFQIPKQQHPEVLDLRSLNVRILKNIKQLLTLQDKDRKYLFSTES